MLHTAALAALVHQGVLSEMFVIPPNSTEVDVLHDLHNVLGEYIPDTLVEWVEGIILENRDYPLEGYEMFQTFEWLDRY